MKSTHVQSPLVRVGLIVVLLAGLVGVGLNLSQLKHKITNLQANLAAQTGARQAAEAALTSTEQKLATTTTAFAQTKATLETVSAEKEQALATAATQTSRAERLTGELSKTRQERDQARDSLARYQAAGLEPEQIVSAAEELKRLKKELAVAQQKTKTLLAQVEQLTPVGRSCVILLPVELKAKVVATDPKWHFIVLDAGENQGVLKNGEMLVSRQGKLVAKVKVSRVKTDRSVADLMPGWDFAEVLEGDVVIPAFPRS